MASEEWPTQNRVVLDGKDYLAWKTWQEEQEERNLHRGDWWISPEGRAVIEDTWPPEKYADGNCVRPLYDKLVSLEGELLDLREEAKKIEEERDSLQEAAAAKQPHSFAIMNWACGHRSASSCNECYRAACIELDQTKQALKSFQIEKETQISCKTPLPTIEGLMATIDHNIEQMHNLGLEIDRLLGENARMVDEISDLRIKLGKYEPIISSICGYTNGMLNCTFWKNACDFKLTDEIVRLKAAQKAPALDQMETFVSRKTEEQNIFSENLSRNETFKIMVATIYNRVRQTTPWDGEDSWDNYMMKCWQQAKDEALFGLGLGLT